jgi:site-specific DNA recombinase
MKQSSKKHELGTAALYCRLSRDDNTDSKSNSIQNQRKILQKAAKDKGYTDTVFFVDDGITGTTMKRPGFQKMLTAIEAGYISAVFVKDLSRLGRNYIEVGKLTEEFFPLHDIRLVAVSDGVDSDEGEDDFTPFKNIMNEYYAKDISKKRRIVNKMKGNAGVPLSPPPYGYIKNPDNPRFWVVEPEAAEVVRRIYRMALEGYGLAEIAARLAADGVVNPTYYWRSRGTSRSGSKSTVEPTKWGHTTVKKILTLQEYCGDVINFKSYSKSYKMKKQIENPEENRAIFLNVHEAIIDRQTWKKVQALQKGTRRKKPTVTQEPSVFSGLLKCPECGGNLNFHFNQNNHDIKFFSCQNHNSGYRKCSKTHYIRLDFLEQVVLYEVKRLACFASEYENDFIKAMIGRSAKVAENTALRKQRELDALTARDRELDMLFEQLYEDNFRSCNLPAYGHLPSESRKALPHTASKSLRMSAFAWSPPLHILLIADIEIPIPPVVQDAGSQLIFIRCKVFQQIPIQRIPHSLALYVCLVSIPEGTEFRNHQIFQTGCIELHLCTTKG